MNHSRADASRRVRPTEEKDLGNGQRLKIYEPVTTTHPSSRPLSRPSTSNSVRNPPHISGFGQPRPGSAAQGSYQHGAITSLEQASAASVPQNTSKNTLASSTRNSTSFSASRPPSVGPNHSDGARTQEGDGQTPRTISKEDARRKMQEAKRAQEAKAGVIREAQVGLMGKQERKQAVDPNAATGEQNQRPPSRHAMQSRYGIPARPQSQPSYRPNQQHAGSRGEMPPPVTVPVRAQKVPQTPLRQRLPPQPQPQYAVDPHALDSLNSVHRSTSPAPSVFLEPTGAFHARETSHSRDIPNTEQNVPDAVGDMTESDVFAPLAVQYAGEAMQGTPTSKLQHVYRAEHYSSGQFNQPQMPTEEPSYMQHLQHMLPEYRDAIIKGIQKEVEVELFGHIFTLQDSLKDANDKLATEQDKNASMEQALQVSKGKEEIFDRTAASLKANEAALQALQASHAQAQAANKALVDETKAQQNELLAERNSIILSLAGPPGEGEQPTSLAEAITTFKRKTIATMRQARDVAKAAQGELDPLKAAHKSELAASNAKIEQLKEEKRDSMQKCRALQTKLDAKEREMLEMEDLRRKTERAHATALTQKENELAEAAVKILEEGKKVEAAQTLLKTYEEELAELEAVITDLENDNDNLSDEIQDKTADFERLVAQFEEARSEVASLKVPSTLPVAQAKSKWQSEMDVAGRELERLKREKAKLESGLQEAKDNLERFTSEAKTTKDKLKAELENLQHKLSSAEAASQEVVTESNKKVSELEAALQRCKEDLKKSREEQETTKQQLADQQGTGTAALSDIAENLKTALATAEERIAAVTLELSEAESKLAMSTALENLGKILDAPGYVRKGLNIHEHQLLRNAHDHLQQQLRLKEREVGQLKRQMKELDPEVNKAQIKELEETLKAAQTTGPSAGLQERWEQDRLTEMEAAVFEMQAKRLKEAHMDQMAPIANKAKKFENSSKAWKQKADSFENLFARILSQDPTTPADIKTALQNINKQHGSGKANASTSTSTPSKPSSSKTSGSNTAVPTSSKAKPVQAGSAAFVPRPASTPSPAKSVDKQAPASSSPLSDLSDEEGDPTAQKSQDMQNVDELDDDEPEPPVKPTAKSGPQAKLKSATKPAPKSSILKATTPVTAQRKTPKTVIFRSPLLSQRSANCDRSPAPSQQEGEDEAMSMDEVDASLPRQEKQESFFQRRAKRRLTDMNIDEDEDRGSNASDADEYATLFDLPAKTAAPQAKTPAPRKAPPPSKARKISKEASLDSIAANRPRRNGSITSYAEPAASMEMPVATQKYGKMRQE